MKIVHMAELPDKPCPHCGKIVKELSRHIKRSHEKLTCDLCGKLVPPGHMLRHNDQYHTGKKHALKNMNNSFEILAAFALCVIFTRTHFLPFQ